MEPVFVPIKIDGPVHDPKKGTFWYGPFSEAAAVFDVNGDGQLDISCGSSWYEGPGWKKHENYRPNAFVKGEFVNNCGEHAVDVNGDGLNDIIYGHGHTYGLGWLEQTRVNDGAAREFREHEIAVLPGQFHTLVLADVNQDGHLDLVTGKRLRPHAGRDPSSFDPLGLFWFDIRGGTFVRHVLSYNNLPWYPEKETRNPPPNYAIGTGMSILVVDVDRDGKVDIVVGGKSGLYLFANRGLPPTPAFGIENSE